MSTTPTIMESGEERFDYGDGLIAYQRACEREGCDRGLIYYPVRNCGACSGSGWKVRWFRVVDGREVQVGGPYSEVPSVDPEDEA